MFSNSILSQLPRTCFAVLVEYWNTNGTPKTFHLYVHFILILLITCFVDYFLCQVWSSQTVWRSSSINSRIHSTLCIIDFSECARNVRLVLSLPSPVPTHFRWETLFGSSQGICFKRSIFWRYLKTKKQDRLLVHICYKLLANPGTNPTQDS